MLVGVNVYASSRVYACVHMQITTDRPNSWHSCHARKGGGARKRDLSPVTGSNSKSLTCSSMGSDEILLFESHRCVILQKFPKKLGSLCERTDTDTDARTCRHANMDASSCWQGIMEIKRQYIHASRTVSLLCDSESSRSWVREQKW